MTDLVSGMILGFQTALTLENLSYCFLGVFLGTFIGVLPGIGALAAVSMLLPITFYLSPTAGVIMLAGVYYGAEYGGSTASILLNLPGTPSSAVTALDGYPMAVRGQAGIALFVTTIASFVGGTAGIVLLMAFAPFLSDWALSFGPADYFAVMILGLIAAAVTNRGAPIKGVAMVTLGVIFGCVGTDMVTGAQRFTFGTFDLADGIDLVALAMGLFGIAEVIASIRGRPQLHTRKVRLRDMLPSREDARRMIMPIVRGTSIGAALGPLPGTGPTLASFMSYAAEKKSSKTPERFGTGMVEGIAGPELSNNAAAQTSFIPTLIMGIPGTPTMALIIGALMIHGITPGPTMMATQPTVFWGLIASFWIGNLLLLILNIPLIGIWVRLLTVPYSLLYPVILVLICVGVYSVNSSLFDVSVAIFFGLVGYGMRILDFEPAPLLIGFVIGPMMEENLRRALSMSGGNYQALIDRPISATVLTITAIMLAWMVWRSITETRGRRAAKHVAG